MTDKLPDSIETDRMTEEDERVIEDRMNEIKDPENYNSTEDVVEFHGINSPPGV